MVGAWHHISDHIPGTDAIAMIREAQTIHLFRQEHDDDIADCVRYFNLEPSNAATLAVLPQGEHLLKIGANKEISVRLDRTAREIRFTETDSAMVSRLPVEAAAAWVMVGCGDGSGPAAVAAAEPAGSGRG